MNWIVNWDGVPYVYYPQHLELYKRLAEFALDEENIASLEEMVDEQESFLVTALNHSGRNRTDYVFEIFNDFTYLNRYWWEFVKIFSCARPIAKKVKVFRGDRHMVLFDDPWASSLINFSFKSRFASRMIVGGIRQVKHRETTDVCFHNIGYHSETIDFADFKHFYFMTHSRDLTENFKVISKLPRGATINVYGCEDHDTVDWFSARRLYGLLCDWNEGREHVKERFLRLKNALAGKT